MRKRGRERKTEEQKAPTEETRPENIIAVTSNWMEAVLAARSCRERLEPEARVGASLMNGVQRLRKGGQIELRNDCSGSVVCVRA